MKRHNSLIPLSRDHHHGLLCSWKIKQGIKCNIEVERMKAYVLYFWDIHLAVHFKEEEELLFGEVHNDLVTQSKNEHEQIKQLIKDISENATTENLNTFANHLHHHIRFEERVLFPNLEQTLEEDKLEQIGSQLNALHCIDFPDDFKDEFWRY